ncbi:MAG: hypothetical protein ACI4EV_07495 [Lachnospiraceae bacterium]
MLEGSITLGDFARIVGNTVNYYPDINNIEINPPVIRGQVRQNGQFYNFELDFDDGGVVTGNYKYRIDSEDKALVLNFADDIQGELDYLLMQQTVRDEVPKSKNRVHIYEDRCEPEKEKFVPELVKCPNCGSNIPTAAHRCSFCGGEIKPLSVADPVKHFVAVLERCDAAISDSKQASTGFMSWSGWAQIGFVVLSVVTFGVVFLIYKLFYGNRSRKPKLSDAEKNKAEVIRDFLFPNDRYAILDGLMFVAGMMTMLISNSFRDKKGVYWFTVWAAKARELKSRADVSFVNDNEINGVYYDIRNMINTFEKRKALKALLIAIAIVILAVEVILICI